MENNRTDYEDILGTQKYLGQHEIYFDADMEETSIQGHAKYVLVWKKNKYGRIGYYPKNL
ncbi:MAG: hypothetical protein WC437_04895 [Patescibacteria group bacterium]|jgi:hypothetical protein